MSAPLVIAPAWIDAPGPRAVMGALEGAGHRAWYVGGAVRNAMLDRPGSDIDIATTALPPETEAAAAAAGLQSVPTGAPHGTITVLAGGAGYEVTTLRRDVETDGRHARVVFSTRIEEDAARRDFTMNALYADARGRVVDPLGGLPDLLAGRVRFIGAPEARITEDYLRILRFFRFLAWYGAPGEGPDAEGLAACAALAEGLDRIAAERIGHEMRKLLAAPDPAPATAAMAAAGVLARILPGASALSLAPLVALETELDAPAHPIRRLAAMTVGIEPEAVADALRLSRAEARALANLARGLADGRTPEAEAQAAGPEAGRDLALLQAALAGQPLVPDLTARLSRAAAAHFPVAAADLMPAFSGAALGRRLAALRAAWVASDFRLDRAALLALPDEATPGAESASR